MKVKLILTTFLLFIISSFLLNCSCGIKTESNSNASINSISNSTNLTITTNNYFYFSSNTFEKITNNLLSIFYTNSYTLIKESNIIVSSNIGSN